MYASQPVFFLSLLFFWVVSMSMNGVFLSIGRISMGYTWSKIPYEIKRTFLYFAWLWNEDSCRWTLRGEKGDIDFAKLGILEWCCVFFFTSLAVPVIRISMPLIIFLILFRFIMPYVL